MSRLGAGLALVGGGLGLGAAAYFWSRRQDDEKPERDLDGPRAASVPPPSTGKKAVDAIFGKLQRVAQDSGIPLGLLVGWIVKESAGRLATHPQPGPGDTKYDERGYFQIMPEESKALGLDHQRLSMDSDYSVDGGVRLIQKYMRSANALGAAPTGTSYFWRLVKLLHTMGAGAAKKVVEAARAAGQAGTWAALERYALDNDRALLASTKHSPAKWFPLVDEVYEIGRPYGFGSEAAGPAVVGLDILGAEEIG